MIQKKHFTGGDSTLIGRIALVPQKIRERGVAWALQRFGDLLLAIGQMFERVAIWALSRVTPYIRSLTRDTLIVTYDLETYPISYDICWYLVLADLHRRRRQLKGFHCTFVPIEDHDTRTFPPGYDAVVDRTSRAWRFNHICMAALELLPSCNGMTVCNSRAQVTAWNALSRRTLFDAARLTRWAPLSAVYRDLIARVPAQSGDWGLRAPEQGLRYLAQWLECHAKNRKVVIVTLRQYAVDTDRNSRTSDWLAFLNGLDRDEYMPVIVPDTDHALEQKDAFGNILCFDEAAWNLGLRMALYESAYMNMFVNCGPASLCILNPRTSYMLFKITVPGIHLASEETLRAMGFEPGTQPSIATARQRWVWQDDRRDVIEREFAAMVEQIENAPQAAH